MSRGPRLSGVVEGTGTPVSLSPLWRWVQRAEAQVTTTDHPASASTDRVTVPHVNVEDRAHNQVVTNVRPDTARRDADQSADLRRENRRLVRANAALKAALILFARDLDQNL